MGMRLWTKVISSNLKLGGGGYRQMFMGGGEHDLH